MVIVNYAQCRKAHLTLVVIIAKRKGVFAIQPAKVGTAALVTASDTDHRSPHLLRRCQGAPLIPDSYFAYWLLLTGYWWLTISLSTLARPPPEISSETAPASRAKPNS